MTLLTATLAAIRPADAAAAARAQARLDGKTKPRGSLGRLEELACRLAAIYGTAEPTLPAKAVVVLAADHGLAEEGVSAYPQEVTAQMVKNFLTGGAAINVLRDSRGARVVVADFGTKQAVDLPRVRDCRLGPGTANCTRGPAMSRPTARAPWNWASAWLPSWPRRALDCLALATWASVIPRPPAPSRRS